MQSANLSGPLKGLRPHQALLGPTQASGLAGGFDWGKETTGSAGGGAPQKSFSFKHRAKRATNSGLPVMKNFVRTVVARLRAVGQVMREK